MVAAESIHDLLVEIKVKVDILVGQHSDHENRLRAVEQHPIITPTVQATVADHEARLRLIERRIWVGVGAAAVAGGLAGQTRRNPVNTTERNARC